MRTSALLGAFAALTLSACSPLTSPPSPPGTSSARSVDRSATQAALDQLAVIARPAADPAYRRTAFGSAWADVDHDGCSQRKDALAAAVDRTQPVVERRTGRCAHDVVAGTWTDPYTGHSLTFTDLTDPRQAQQIPIDHVVALANAFRYGADTWTPAQRRAFANDLANLQPTARSTNLSKSDRDPASWRPTRLYQCAYAARYIDVKVKYELPVDASEKRALTSMVDTCP